MLYKTKTLEEKSFTHIKSMILKTLLIAHVMNVIGLPSVIDVWSELVT